MSHFSKPKALQLHKAVFIDRDGVINEDSGLPHRRKDIIFLPGVKEALRQLRTKGFLLICVTNQPSVARGLITEKEAKELNDFINSKIDHSIDQFYFCPHHPNADLKVYRKVCTCRKPASGMLLKAAKDYSIDLRNSWLVGDRITDIIAGKSVGCKTVLIKSPNNGKVIESGTRFNILVKPDRCVEDLLQASRLIVRLSR